MSEIVTLETVYGELRKIEEQMVTKRELAQLTETVAILSNPATMDQLKRSTEDIAHGRVAPVSSVKDLLRDA